MRCDKYANKKEIDKGSIVSQRTDGYLFCPSVGVAIMSLQHPPVNSLSLDFLTEFCSALEKLEMDKSCRGVIVTSVKSNIVAFIIIIRWKCTVSHAPVWLLNPGTAQGVLGWAGYHGDVWEKSRTLWGVLESCSGDVAETLQFQHGYDCSN